MTLCRHGIPNNVDLDKTAPDSSNTFINHFYIEKYLCLSLKWTSNQKIKQKKEKNKKVRDKVTAY